MVKKLKHDHLPEKYQEILKTFFDCYTKATGKEGKVIEVFLELLEKQLKTPFSFKSYHQKIREPFDYYQFSLDFIRPLIDIEHSAVSGLELSLIHISEPTRPY